MLKKEEQENKFAKKVKDAAEKSKSKTFRARKEEESSEEEEEKHKEADE